MRSQHRDANKGQEKKKIRLKLFNLYESHPKTGGSSYKHQQAIFTLSFWSESKCFVLFLVAKRHSIGASKIVFYNDGHRS